MCTSVFQIQEIKLIFLFPAPNFAMQLKSFKLHLPKEIERDTSGLFSRWMCAVNKSDHGKHESLLIFSMFHLENTHFQLSCSFYL